MRDVGKERAEGDDELDSEVLERPAISPAKVRQRVFGSIPSRSTASRSIPGIAAW